MTLRAVLFDLGDTLLDFEPVDTRALFRRAAAASHARLASLGPEVATKLPPLDHYTRAHHRAVKWAYFWAKLTGREFNLIDLLARFHRRFDLPADDALLRQIAWDFYAPVLPHARTEPDLPGTLARLHESGLALGVVSNTFVPAFVHDRHLDLAGLLEFLPHRLYSSELGFRKPDRRIFQAATDLLGVLPRETLFVGDLVKTDIVGARRAGMRTALKQPYSNPRPHRAADYTIHRIADLFRVVPELRNATPQLAH